MNDMFAWRVKKWKNETKRGKKNRKCFIKYSPLEDDFPSNLLLKYYDIMFFRYHECTSKFDTQTKS